MFNMWPFILSLLGPVEILCVDPYALMESGRISQALDDESLNDEELANIGNTCAGLTKYEEALPFYDKAIEKSLSKKASHFKLRGECHLNMKNWGAAIMDFERAIKLKPDDEDNLVGLKRARLSQRCYLLVDDKFSSNLKAADLYDCGFECQGLNMLTEASRYYTAAIAKTPEKDYYSGRGKCYDEMRNFGAAESDYRKVLEMDPRNRSVRRELSKLLFNTGKFEEAIEEMLLSHDYDGTDLELLGNKFMMTAKRFVQAFRCYGEALERCPPGDAIRYCNRRYHCSEAIRSQDPEKAAQDLKKVLDMEPTNLSIRMHLVEALLKAGHFGEAMKVSKNLGNTELLIVGYNMMRGRRYEEAIVCFTDFIERNSQNPIPSSYTHRGACYRQLKIFDKAIADFRKNLELQPHNWPGHADLCEVLFEAGEIDEAKKVVQFAEGYTPSSEVYSETLKRIRHVKEKFEQEHQESQSE